MSDLQLIQDIGILNKGLELLHIGFAPHPRGPQQIELNCLCLRHSDGSLSALWPASFKRPPLLRFLPMLTRSERKKARHIRLAEALNQPVIAGMKPLKLYASDAVMRRLNHYPEWAIFIASPGRERRMLAWHRDNDGKAAVTKLSLSIQAAKGIFKERKALHQTLPDGMLVPGVLDQKGYAFTQEDMQDVKELMVPLQLSELPDSLMQEWLKTELKTKPLGQTGWYRDTQYWLLGQQAQPTHDKSEILQQKIRLLFECMAPEASVPVSRAHGDFTPRHLRLMGKKLLVTGWRMSEEDLPAMFDWFQFVYYSRTILDEKSFAEIRKEIDERLSEPQWEDFFLQHDIDAGEAEQQYLLCAISRNLQGNSPNDESGKKLLQVWCEALGFWMDFEGILNHRQIVLQDIMHFLHEQSYAALGLPDPDITMLPLSERLELLIVPQSAFALRKFLKRHRGVLRVRAHRIDEGWRFSVFLCGGGTIHISCITRLWQGRHVFGTMNQVLAQAEFIETGIKRLPHQEEMNFQRFRRAKHLGKKMEVTEMPHAESGSVSNWEHAAWPAMESKGIRRLMHGLQHKIEFILSLAPVRGFVITFSGVDEAGQRTVIEATRHRIRQELQVPVVVLPHRPSMAVIRSLNQSSRKLAVQSRALLTQQEAPSFFKRMLRPAEDLLVQLHILFRFVLRGHVVLYDQYYACDEVKSSKVKLPSILTHWWHRFLLKPDLNVLLYAPAELVKQRSQVLSTEDIEHITGEYLALFQKMGQRAGQKHFISVRNTRLGDTLETVFKAIHIQQPA